MFRLISRSQLVLFFIDLVTLGLLTLYWYNYFNLSSEYKIETIILTIVVCMVSLYMKENYKLREHNITNKNSYLLFEGIVIGFIPTIITGLIFGDYLQFLKFILVDIFSIYIFLRLYRVCMHYYLFKYKKNKRVLIVGLNDRAKDIAEEIINRFALKMEIAGIVNTSNFDKKFEETTMKVFGINSVINKPEEDYSEDIIIDSKIPVIDLDKNLEDIIKENNVDIVIFTKKTWLMGCLPNNVHDYYMPDFYELITGKFYVDLANCMDFRCEFSTKNTLFYDFQKRIFDIVSALIILIATLPITAYIAIRVKLTDGASPFFTQTRVGYNGRTFECYKLRTMYVNDFVPKNKEDVKYAESVSTDDRIMPFCRFVRKARFDEIPQMVNVLKNEMSVVGPRAEWDEEAKIFDREVPMYRLRNLVKAGWTGWSHINMNPVFTTDEEKERLAYDIYYIKHRNIPMDLMILVKAIFLALSKRHK